MAIRKILTYPDPVLRQQAKPVTEFNDSLKHLVEDMIETMYAAPGVGLAANQIGVTLQIIVIDPSREKEIKYPLAFINPTIEKGEGSQRNEEGCLSMVDFSATIKRFQKIWVRTHDLTGAVMDFEADDFLARVIQHEVDHLNGILCIDRVSALKRALYKKRLKKQLEDQ